MSRVLSITGSITHRALAGLIFLFLSARAWAVPFPPFPIELENPDGSKIWARLFGDEFLGWVEDLDGYSMVRDPFSGYFHYATLDADGRLAPTRYRPGLDDPKQLGLTPRLMPSEELRAQARWFRQKAQSPIRTFQASALQGDIPNLVLLVKFTDQNTTYTKADFEQVFNSATGSVQAYYREVSYGKWNMISTITEWIPLAHETIYYTWNEDYQTGRPDLMIVEAVNQLNSQGFDFTKFDNNDDGVIDAVDVIHTGPGYEYTENVQYIHSHFTPIQEITTHDGIRINAYHTEPEFRADLVQITQIGVIAHETAHFFGLPDFYDYNGLSTGTGIWDLMAAGPWGGPQTAQEAGTVPSHPSAYCKEQLGFANVLPIQLSTAGLTMQPAETVPLVMKISHGMPAGQYFILENRNQIGFDLYLPAGGLLIYHVDENMPDNNNRDHYWVDLEQADGQRHLNKNSDPQSGEGGNAGDPNDPYPTDSNTQFTPSTNPSCLPYGGGSCGINLTKISRSGENITFDAVLDGTSGSLILVFPSTLEVSAKQGDSDRTMTPSLFHQGLTPLAFTSAAQNDWLKVTPESGTTPQEVVVTVSGVGLPVGEHTGTVQFSSAAASNTPAELTVVLHLAEGPPTFQLSPTSMTFSTKTNDPPPAAQALSIVNRGGGTLNWTATPSENWVQLSELSATAPSQINISVNATGMSSGEHQTKVNFSAPDAQPVELAVILNISAQAYLNVSPPSLSLVVPLESAPGNPVSLDITNTKEGAMSWTASCEPVWLLCEPSSGTAPGQLKVLVDSRDPQLLAVGNYTGTITISSPEAENNSISINVGVEIQEIEIVGGCACEQTELDLSGWWFLALLGLLCRKRSIGIW